MRVARHSGITDRRALIRDLPIESVDFLGAGVAEQKRRVVGGQAEPDIVETCLPEVLQVGHSRAAYSSTTVPRSRRLWLTARRFGRVPSLSRSHTRHQKDDARIVCANSETTLEIISTRALLLLLLRHNWQNQLVYRSSIIAQPDVQLGPSGMRHALCRPSESIGHRGALLKLGVR